MVALTTIIILLAGFHLTLKTHFIQFRLFPKSLAHFFHSFSCSEHNSFRALCVALSATIGTGNLVGVAGAICLGGPGVLFWMMLFALIGMVLKFSESTLAVHYRQKIHSEFVGGPMYIIKNGLHRKWLWLAYLYSFAGMVSCFGIGNSAQVNAIITAVRSTLGPYSPPSLALGLFLALLFGYFFHKGSISIGKAAELFVPFAVGAYILVCTHFLILHRRAIPSVLYSIWIGAFSPKAVTAGALGSAFRTLQIGCCRSIFSNEAGIGTSAIAHASSNASHPAEQGMMGIIETFLDTNIVCFATGMILLTSRIHIPYGTDTGAELLVELFASIYGKFGTVFFTVFLSFFAFATILGWTYYGLQCFRFLFRRTSSSIFLIAQCAVIIAASTMNTAPVWMVSEILNGFMAVPNLFALLLLTPVLTALIAEYKKRDASSDASRFHYSDKA